MKKVLTLLITVVLASTVMVFENEAKNEPTTECEVEMSKHKRDDTSLPKEGRRSPAHHCVCSISLTHGVSLPSLENSIETFEILDIKDKTCVAIYTDEHDFTSCLFSMTGIYMIRFTTEDYEFVGYIEI